MMVKKCQRRSSLKMLGMTNSQELLKEKSFGENLLGMGMPAGLMKLDLPQILKVLNRVRLSERINLILLLVILCLVEICCIGVFWMEKYLQKILG